MEYTNTREKIIHAIQYDGKPEVLSDFLDIPLEEFERIQLDGKTNVILTVRDGIDTFANLSINIGDYVVKNPNVTVVDKGDFELEYSPSPYYRIRNNILLARERLIKDSDYYQKAINIEESKKLKKQEYDKPHLDWLLSKLGATSIVINEFNRALTI